MGKIMKRYEISNPSAKVKQEAYALWLTQIKAVKELAKIEDLNIYDLNDAKNSGIAFSKLHSFALTVLFKLDANEIRSNDIKIFKLKNNSELITIFNIPAQTIYKNLFERDCVNAIYYKRMGWEK